MQLFLTDCSPVTASASIKCSGMRNGSSVLAVAMSTVAAVFWGAHCGAVEDTVTAVSSHSGLPVVVLVCGADDDGADADTDLLGGNGGTLKRCYCWKTMPFTVCNVCKEWLLGESALSHTHTPTNGIDDENVFMRWLSTVHPGWLFTWYDELRKDLVFNREILAVRRGWV